MLAYGTEEQKADWIDDLADGTRGFAFGITEPEHGSDATYMETTAVRDGDEWVINGEKTWNTGIHARPYDLILARTSGEAGDGDGHHGVPRADRRARASRSTSSCGRSTCRPTTPTSALTDVRVPDAAIFGGEGRGLQVVQHFFNENRIRQAASSLGAAQFCIDESVEYAKARKPFGKPLATNQAIQFPLVELQTQCEMLRALDPQDRMVDGHVRRVLAVGQGVDVQLLGEPACAARRPTGRCRCTAGSATRATSRSSTSTGTTAATASPRAPRRSRCAGSPATCSAS